MNSRSLIYEKSIMNSRSIFNHSDGISDEGYDYVNLNIKNSNINNYNISNQMTKYTKSYHFINNKE